jgi:hypothetical protein
LWVALALSAFAWIAFLTLRPSAESIPEVDSTRFRSIEGIAAVVQRPPSLFVTVEDAHWRGLAADQRRELVQRLADVVSPVGFRGIHVKLESGASAAQWLHESGVRLVETAYQQPS